MCIVTYKNDIVMFSKKRKQIVDIIFQKNRLQITLNQYTRFSGYCDIVRMYGLIYLISAKRFVYILFLSLQS